MTAPQDLKVNWKNVPTRTITVGGVEFAYRELGTNNPGPPVVFLVHLAAVLDNCDNLNVLSAFLAVAKQRSFTRAAKGLGVSISALSHAIRGLEERIGVRLLARTTRSVAPTDAGQQLIAHLRPALGDIEAVLDQISGLRDEPAGRVRLVASPLAAAMVLAPKLGHFARGYPDVVLDVTVDASHLDLVAAGFDAGIHLGEFIQQDMVAVKVSRDQRAAIWGLAPIFRVASHADITARSTAPSMHCRPTRICRRLSVGVRQGRQSLAVAVNGPLVVNDLEVMTGAAIDGVGLAFTLEDHAAPHLASGALVRVLED